MSDDIQALASEFSEFVSEHYSDVIDQIIEKDEMRLIVNIDTMRAKNPALADKFLARPIEYFNEFQRTVENIVHLRAKEKLAKELSEENDEMEEDEKVDMSKRAYSNDRNGKKFPYFLGFEGSFGSKHVTPRGLRANFISNMVCIDGIVTKCSLVRPKVMKSVHYCEKTKEMSEKQYSDATLDDTIPTSASYLSKDAAGNPLVTEYGLCEYKDSQCLTIQEMPECSPAGQLPRSIEIFVDNDLVDSCKPGDRLQVVGIYRALPMTTGGGGGANGTRQSTRFRTVLICNCIKKLDRETDGPKFTPRDVVNIREASKNENLFELLAQSMAPSIFGHDYIKKSLLLLLLGGVEKNLPNGTHLRGDINILMVGDPSTAKSQLLRFVLNIAPLAINTTGRGSSGVGLTAAVTSDSETGERRLEAGAMVLADRGIVCIDEFDKMGYDDRVAIHEVMEQQTVTISKAGIHASLNARCSVVAAANPIYGQYNRYKRPHENICLPDSLLSRFDLLFIVLDQANPDHDRHISEHILRMHRYRRASDSETCFIKSNFKNCILDLQTEPSSILGGEMDIKQIVEEDLETPVYQKVDKLLHGERENEIFSIPFIQKYLHFAKSRTKPMLTDEAREFIISSYTELRSKEGEKTLPITTRTLETLIRLSTAHAKCRLSLTVERSDAEVAIDILHHALFSETEIKTKPRNLGVKRKNEKQQAKDKEDEEMEDDEANGADENNNDKEDQDGAENNNNNNNDNNDNDNVKNDNDEEENNQTIVQTKKKVKKDNQNSSSKSDQDTNSLDETVIKRFGGEVNRLLISGVRDIDGLKKKLLKKYPDFDKLLQHHIDIGKIHRSKDNKIRSMVG
ncbi:MCM family protein [Heterostelium album PN500]|uniref:DNA replication licensing factor MCM3 n=1 Tax=Heterostelium pallidum (strain ATCC 26659 / Pp 5 / PN500) TaxID=670386 RepID=D3B0M9_HETP5|nr:MCM family protein [Heterostelium album PN500]EFA84853.1 MCM family protein [Heterostelium album PN500]|eukprot:XP_020436964.1 MCM family protein [Heterostelium album PN500]